MSKTYGDVLLLTRAKLGDSGCSFTDEEFVFALQHCLSEVSRVAPPQFYNDTVNITLIDGQARYSIPQGFYVEAVKNANGVCISNAGDFEACTTSPVATAPRVDIIPNALRAVIPTSYTIEVEDFIEFTPVPNIPTNHVAPVFKLVGMRAPSDVFYIDTVVGPVTTRTWQVIDVPDAYYPALTFCVLGNLSIDKDPGLSSNFFALANDSIKTIRKLNTRKSKPVAMFAKRDSSCDCSCDGVIFPGIIQFDGSLTGGI